MTNHLSDADKKFIADVRADIERKKNIPSDMGFAPFSTKFAEGAYIRMEWLQEYLLQRLHPIPNNKFDQNAFLFKNGVSKPNLFGRYAGALLGLAVGDALGTTLEFEQRDVKHVSDIVGGGPFGLQAGWWTDDTSMACCLAYSLIKCKGFNPEHLMECFSKWYLYGAYSPTGTCFDIGGTTKFAIDSFLKNGNPYAGSDHPSSAGNGSLMRLAPIALYYYPDFEKMLHYAAESSRVTHAALEAIDACRYFAGLLYGALHGESKDILLSDNYTPIPGYWQKNPLCSSIAKIACGTYKNKSRSEIRSSGYVVDTLEAALWSFYRNSDFQSALIEAVNLAGDADTVGAVCGQICGAYYGEIGIPINWIVKVNGMQGFYHFAEDLIRTPSAADNT